MPPGALLGETTGLFCVDVLNREGSCVRGWEYGVSVCSGLGEATGSFCVGVLNREGSCIRGGNTG